MTDGADAPEVTPGRLPRLCASRDQDSPFRSPRPPALPHRPGRVRRIRAHGGGPLPARLRPILQRDGGMWEPGSRRWLVTRHNIGPVIRALERETDPLFRQAGMSLD
jgi:hypothetical protein